MKSSVQLSSRPLSRTKIPSAEPMSRFREQKRRMRRDLHREAAVPALYIPVPSATPVPCTVRVHHKGTPLQVGNLPGLQGSAQTVEPEDRIRFQMSDFPAPLRRNAVISVETGEAYRIDHVYPADDEFQSARVIVLSPDEATGLPVPA